LGGASTVRKTIVEIGPAHWPNSQAFMRLDRPGELHKIVQLPDGVQLLPEGIVRALPQAQARRLEFLDAGKKRLPVKPASADEVYLSDPSMHKANDVVFKLAAKLLKPDGRLFIAEQANPFAFPASRARELAAAAGLEPVELRTGRKSAGWHQPFAHSFKPLPARFADQRYLFTARRPNLSRSPRKR